MKIGLVSLVLCGTTVLAACQPNDTTLTTAAGMSAGSQARLIETETPPEYIPCSELERKLAVSDAKVRAFSSRNTSSEAIYWRDRNKRLIARAYECQRPR
ncbi:hypothetical protein DSD19_04040 [Rhodovulum sp. BSW8]|uniref:Lipoprotein n=1 Tax=Rhodovulum visakhapatnamense TaxID=364297 RepID=A0A4R8FD89_9RHOB|nr:hypothetical protein [Rhodovulum]RBO54557.1 hypothetical protein DSD19_04040 [Rhodovulum sp. BSW8]TDX23756.1 hypothetical protein EV657_12521 [Rhodovulum visakhapatnamense]